MVRRETYWFTISDCNGAIEQELSFDAWGNRRNPETWYGPVSVSDAAPLFDRGFTGHEHLYAFGLINMNGRMYDPLEFLDLGFLFIDQDYSRRGGIGGGLW